MCVHVYGSLFLCAYCMCFFFILYLLCVFVPDHECMYVFVCVCVRVGVREGVHASLCMLVLN